MWFLKKFAAIIVTSLILLIVILIFSFNIYFKTVEQDFIELNTDKTNSQIDIYLHNISGIKTIVAQNEKDAYFALGYIHAQDRLFQMDLKRRLAEGKLAEIFGKKYIDADILFRNLAIKEIARKSLLKLDKNTKKILQSYANGINEFINNNKTKLSLGFIYNDYIPEKWSVLNCLEIFKLWSLENSLGFQLDPLFGKIASKIGVNKTLQLIPKSLYNFHSNDLSSHINASSSYKTKIQYTLGNFEETISKLKEINLFNSSALCNIWILKNTRSSTQTPLLVNDYHSLPTLPSQWYQVHILYDNNNLAGITIPGYPFMISGRNEQITWGLSSANIDNFDYFIEKRINKDYLVFESDTLKIKYIKDTIFIKDKLPLVYYKEKFKNKFLLNINPLIIKNISTFDIQSSHKRNFAISFNWTGESASNESKSLLKISKSSSIFEIRDALKSWISPNMNFICGDISGNIAQFNVGAIPQRAENNNLILPAKRWSEKHKWNNYGKPGIQYSLINPKNKFLLSANTQHIPNLKSYYYDTPFRYKRIKSLIEQYNSIEDYIYEEFDAQKMLMDNYSTFAEIFLKKLRPLITKNFDNLSPEEQEYITKLSKWNFISSYNKSEPTMFTLWLNQILHNTFQDNLGFNNFKYLLNYPQYLYGKLIEILDEPYSFWFDNKNTPKIENRAFIVFKSLKEAIRKGTKIYSTKDFTKWKYEKINTLKLNYLYTNFNIYSIPQITIPISGDFSSINKNYINYITNENKVLPTMRLIIDLASDNIKFSIPGGISEEPMSSYFKNQLNLWSNGGLIELNLTPNYKNLTKIISIK